MHIIDNIEWVGNNNVCNDAELSQACATEAIVALIFARMMLIHMNQYMRK